MSGTDNVSVRGADEFLRLSKSLKAAGQTGLRKELNKAMQAAAKPLIPKVKAAAAATLPKRGGLAQRVARKPYRVQVRTGEATAGVRITAAKIDPRIDEGRLFHPVFGRKPGVVQSVTPGYFSDTMSESGPAVRDDLAQALEDFAGSLLREV